MSKELENRQLFVFWQFNGDNSSFCQLHCPECYGAGIKTGRHYWNGKVEEWEKAFERLNRDIYFVFSYGEALVSKGFYDCVDMIGKHENWTLCVISNLMANPSRLVKTRLSREHRLFMLVCWHPEGVNDPVEGWKTFKKHLLILKAVKIPVHVQMVWFPPVIRNFPYYFKWLDNNDFRVGVRRFVTNSLWSKIPVLRNLRWFVNRYHLWRYSEGERGYIYAYTCPKVTKYGLNLVSPRGRKCYAGKDMILVRHDGTVVLCASTEFFKNYVMGNLFDSNFKLPAEPVRCPTNNCGGDFGMLVLDDPTFGPLPAKLWNDTFVSQVENIAQTSPVHYRRRENMLYWIEKLKRREK